MEWDNSFKRVLDGKELLCCRSISVIDKVIEILVIVSVVFMFIRSVSVIFRSVVWESVFLK